MNLFVFEMSVVVPLDSKVMSDFFNPFFIFFLHFPHFLQSTVSLYLLSSSEIRATLKKIESIDPALIVATSLAIPEYIHCI